MSGHDTDVIDEEEVEKKKRDEALKHEQELVKTQNDLYFKLLGLTPKKSDSSKVSDSWSNSGKLKEYKEKLQKKEEKEKSELKYQTLYEDLLIKYEATLKPLLKNLPATKDTIYELMATRTEAGLLVLGDAPKYEEAYEKLKKHNLDKALEGVPALVKKANEVFEKQAPKSFKEFNDQLKIARSAPLAKEVIGDFEERLRKEAEPAMDPVTDPGKVDTTCLGNLQAIGVELARAISDANTAKQKYEELTKTGTGLTKLERTAPGNLDEFTDTVIAELRRKRQNAKTAYALQDYVVAYKALQSLADDCSEWEKDLHAELIGSYRDWKDRAGPLADALKHANEIANSTTAPQPLKDQAAEIASGLQELADADPEAGRECNEAVAQFESLRISLNGLSMRTDESAGFGATQTEAVKPNDARLGEVATALNLLEQKLSGRQDLDPSLREKTLGPLKARLKDILNTWLDLKLKAYDSVSLDAETIAGQLNVLAADIADAGADDEITALVKSPELERAQNELKAALDEAMKVQLKIMTFNPEEGLGNRAFLQEVEKFLTTSDDPSLLDSVRDQLKKEIERQNGLAVFAEERIKALREQIDQHLESVPAQLSEQGTLIGKLRGGDTRKAYEAMQNTLQTEHESVVAMSSSDQISVLEQAVADAKELALEAKNFLLELKNKPVDDPKEPTGVMEIKKLLEQVESELKSSKVAEEYAIVTYSGLQERLEQAKTDLGKSTMAAMTKEMRAIYLAIVAMREQAEKARIQFEGETGFQAEYAAIKKMLHDKAFTENAPDYVKTATKELATLEKNAKFEGGYETATADAITMRKALEVLLNSAKDGRGVPVLILEKQTQTAEENKKKELQKTKWETELEIIGKDLTAAKSINPTEIKGLKTLVKNAKKAVEKSADYSFGRTQLEQVRTKLALIKQNPRGLAIASRNQLAGVNGLFRKAVLEFGKALQDVEKAVSPNLEGADQTAFAKQVVEVRSLLNPAVFAPHIKIIMTTEDDTKRSTEREKALAGARRMMAYVKGDYRMRELARTPSTVNANMAGILSKVYLALLNMENNLLVSL